MNAVKNRVDLSGYSCVMTFMIFALLGFFIYRFESRGEFISMILFCAMLCAWCLLALFYMPLSVSANEKTLTVNRPIWFKRIPLAEIESIELMPSTLAEKRVFCSGGFLGYWGWFSSPDLGRYFAYYGKSSDCFFVRLKNGRQYMIGCRNPQSIVDHVKSYIAG